MRETGGAAMGGIGQTFLCLEWVMETSMAAETWEKTLLVTGFPALGSKGIVFPHNEIFQWIPSGQKDWAYCR